MVIRTIQDTTGMMVNDQERLALLRTAVHSMTIGDALTHAKAYLPIRAGHTAAGVQQLHIYAIRCSKESDHLLDLQVDIGQSTVTMGTVICSDIGRIALEDLFWPGAVCCNRRAEFESVKRQERSQIPIKEEYISSFAVEHGYVYWGHGKNACGHGNIVCAYNIDQLEKTRAGRKLIALACPPKKRDVRNSKSMEGLARQPALPLRHVECDSPNVRRTGQTLQNVSRFAATDYNSSRGYLGSTPELLKRQQSTLGDVNTTSLCAIRKAVGEKGGTYTLSHIGQLVDDSVEIPYSPTFKINGIYRPQNYNGPGDLRVLLGKSIVPLGALVSCSVGSLAIIELFWPERRSAHQRSIAEMIINFVTHRWDRSFSGQHFDIVIVEEGYRIRWGNYSAEEYEQGDLAPTLAGQRAIQISSGPSRKLSHHDVEGLSNFTPILARLKRMFHRF